MGRIRAGLLTLAIIMVTSTTSAQVSNVTFNVQGLGGFTTGEVVPFWLRANNFGSVPLAGASLSLIGSVKKVYNISESRLFDWGASFEGRANLGKGSNMSIIEGYGKFRLGIFELRAGRYREITGLCDTLLTSGSWAVSGTSLGIPEVELAVRNFWSIPWFDQLFAFKGTYSHGWLGTIPMARFILQDTLMLDSYLHQKSFYGRIGKPEWRIKLYGGFNHQVVWGHEQEYYTEVYTLSPVETYLHVITGLKYSSGYIQEERQGNHMGSIDLGMEYKFDKVKLLLYRQNFYEAGALARFANIQDGLNGISIENLHKGEKPGLWNRVLFEFLYTKNQAGEPWSPETGSAYEPYYNHGQYVKGWSYLGVGLGTSFVGTRAHIRENLPAHPMEYFINNRVMAFHFGYEGIYKDFGYLFKASWSKNYGTYRTTDEEQSTNLPDPGSLGIFGEVRQFSGFLEMNKKLDNRFNIGLVGAFDFGELYYNSFGLFLKAAYSFEL